MNKTATPPPGSWARVEFMARNAEFNERHDLTVFTGLTTTKDQPAVLVARNERKNQS